MATVPRSREIDVEAVRLFERSLPSSWLSRKQHPDIRIDHVVELVSDGEPTGINFGAQVKGTEKLKVVGDTIRFRMEVKHLVYFADRALYPIFLVVVDVLQGRGYWLFLQEYLLDNPPKVKWRKQKKLTVRVPLANALGDAHMFESAIQRAHDYMLNLHPGSIEAAVAAEQERLESLDRRIGVKISHNKGHNNFVLTPKEDFKFTMTLSGTDADALTTKAKDLYERGLDVTFEGHQLGFTGSELLEKIAEEFAEGLVVISASHKLATEIYLTNLDASGRELATLGPVSGILARGRSEARFEGRLEASPVAIRFAFPLDLKRIGEGWKFTIEFDFSTWAGTPVLILPHFDRHHAFYASLADTERTKLVCETRGRPLLSSDIDLKDDSDNTVNGLDFLAKARWVARHFGVNPVFPGTTAIQLQDIDSVLALHALANGGEHRLPGKGTLGQMKVSFTKRPTQELIDVELMQRDLVHVTETSTFAFFGTEVSFGPLRVMLTKALLLADPQEILDTDGDSLESGVMLRWEGTAESEVVLSAIVAEESN